MSELYFQKGFGLKSEVGPVLARTYQSAVVERFKATGYEAGAGTLHFKLAKEFGFCYGVDRAVDYAYQTRRQFLGAVAMAFAFPPFGKALRPVPAAA